MKKLLFLLPLTLGITQADQIKSIKFEGLIHLSPEVAREISGLSVGEELTNEASNNAIINLFKQNYFEDIYITNDNGNVIVTLKEKPSIARVELKGVVTNDQKAIQSLIDIKAGNMYDTLSIERTINKIRQFYEAKGYFDTVVDVEKKQVEDGPGLYLTLNINRGENLIIKNVNLVGAKKFDYDDVEPIVANKSKEFMGWMWGRNDGKVKLYELPQDSERIKDLYFQKGYLDATVSEPFLNAYFDSYTADLAYYITEGEQYKISKITISAPDELELNTDKIIKDELNLGAGDIINSLKVRKDISIIENIVADKGYAFVVVNPKTQKDKENHTVQIDYEIIPGEKVTIRNVIISGNDRTSDKVVRRELYLTEGQTYNRTDLQDSTDALKRTSYFEDANIKEQRISADQIDLLVEVKEASTGSISGGIGYGSSDGLLLNASLSDTNILGSGLKGIISVDRSDNELSGQIGITNPRLFDSQYSLGGTIYANDYKWRNYNERSYGFNTTLGRQLTRNLSASITYVIERSNISGLSSVLKNVGYKEGTNLKSAIIPAISYNNTDDYYLPRRGILTGSSLEFAGIGGDEKFLKSRSYFNYYFGLADYIDYDLILRYKSNFAKIWDRGYVPINERLYLGGISSIRGFENKTVSPKLQFGGSWYETGGEISFNNSFEISFPIIDRIKMRGVLFYDYGMIGKTSLNEIKRSSVGTGIEWITPIGPLQLIFAKALNPASNDETSKFEFSIGRRF